MSVETMRSFYGRLLLLISIVKLQVVRHSLKTVKHDIHRVVHRIIRSLNVLLDDSVHSLECDLVLNISVLGRIVSTTTISFTTELLTHFNQPTTLINFNLYYYYFTVSILEFT